MAESNYPIIEAELAQQEKIEIDKILCSYLGLILSDTAPVFSARLLDRALSNTEQQRIIAEKLTPDVNEVIKGGNYSTLQESDRIRRDVLISNMRHKRIMYACLDQLYRRGNELNKL